MSSVFLVYRSVFGTAVRCSRWGATGRPRFIYLCPPSKPKTNNYQVLRRFFPNATSSFHCSHFVSSQFLLFPCCIFIFLVFPVPPSCCCSLCYVGCLFSGWVFVCGQSTIDLLLYECVCVCECVRVFTMPLFMPLYSTAVSRRYYPS